MRRGDSRKIRKAFALYEVLLGLAIFAIGVVALGRAVENCLNASAISAEEDVVRQILSNQMAEIQVAQGVPDAAKEFKVDSVNGVVKVIQKSVLIELTEPDNTIYLARDHAGGGDPRNDGAGNFSLCTIEHDVAAPLI